MPTPPRISQSKGTEARSDHRRQPLTENPRRQHFPQKDGHERPDPVQAFYHQVIIPAESAVRQPTAQRVHNR